MNEIKNASILVVDDTPANLDLLTQILKARDYEVRPLLDSRHTLRTVLIEPPDLILLDIRMPTLNGYEVCAQLKAEPRICNIPVIFISALQSTEDKLLAFDAGGVDYITKPFQPEEVLARVDTHLRLNALQRSLQSTNSQLSTLLNSAGEGILGLDCESHITFINNKALEYLGFTESELTGVNFHNHVHHTHNNGSVYESQACPIMRTIREGGTRFMPHELFFRKDGTPIDVEYTVSSAQDTFEKNIGIILFRDISQRIRMEQQLKEAAAVFEVSSEGITLTDTRGVISRVNPAFTEITGYTADEAIGQTPRLLKSGHHPDDFYKDMWQKLVAEGYWEGEIWNRRKDGSIYPEWEMISAIYDNQGEVIGYVSQFSDITRRKLTEEEIRYRGNYDALTGLVNRSLLQERLKQSIRQYRRKDLKLGLMFIDLDKFKQINDTLGHAAGDLLLQQVAKRIMLEIREIDTAARLGGDEFVILLTDLENQFPTERVAARLIESLCKPYDLDGQEAHISASIGVALFPDDGDNMDLLMRNADLAMYRAKNNGRNQVQFFAESVAQEYRERNQMEADLRLALKRNELSLHYQPIVDIRNSMALGVESLIRWQHPVRGFISPAYFIPLAEESNLINEIGAWCIETACRQLSQWQTEGIDLYASVNISALQIPKGVPVEWIAQLIESYQITSDKLVFEITESLFVNDVTQVGEWLSDIRKLGVCVYLDDFGTGYSSLSYLKRFPVDAVKIDRIFINDLTHDNSDLAMVSAVLLMCRGLGLQVVAEGIETVEQLNKLRELECSYGQGYLFSKPVPPEQIADAIRTPVV